MPPPCLNAGPTRPRSLHLTYTGSRAVEPDVRLAGAAVWSPSLVECAHHEVSPAVFQCVLCINGGITCYLMVFTTNNKAMIVCKWNFPSFQVI